MKTRSMPTPTMLIGGTLAQRPSAPRGRMPPPNVTPWWRIRRIPAMASRSTNHVTRSSRPGIPTVDAQPRVGIEQHVGLLPLLGRVVVEPSIGGPLVERRSARDRRRQPVLAGQHPRIGTPLIVLTLRGIESGQ